MDIYERACTGLPWKPDMTWKELDISILCSLGLPSKKKVWENFEASLCEFTSRRWAGSKSVIRSTRILIFSESWCFFPLKVLLPLGDVHFATKIMIFCIHLYKNFYLRLDDGCMFFVWIVRPSPCPNIGQVSKQLNIRLLPAGARRSQSLSTAELMEVKGCSVWKGVF